MTHSRIRDVTHDRWNRKHKNVKIWYCNLQAFNCFWDLESL